MVPLETTLQIIADPTHPTGEDHRRVYENTLRYIFTEKVEAINNRGISIGSSRWWSYLSLPPEVI